MRRVISLLIAAVLMFCLLAGCQAEEGLSLSARKDLEIRQAFMDWVGAKEYTAEDLTLRLVWKRDDTYALYVDGPFWHTDAARGFTLEGMEFVFPNSQRLYIHNEGQFYTLQEAHEKSVLTKGDLESLYEGDVYKNVPFPNAEP